ncbi:MAG: zinc-dependent alcohol dehydrogenase [Spirochaetota bacterium]
MKTAWAVDKKKIETNQIDYSPPGDDQVAVKIKACGICGTDLHFYNDLPGGSPIPLGHEVSGEIYQTGKNAASLKKGQPVVVQNHIPCGRCTNCLNGNYSLCKNILTYMEHSAGMAEYLVVPKKMVIPFEDLTHVEAAIAEPITVALDLTQEAKLEPMHSVLVSGPGIIGLCSIRLSKTAGAEKIAALGRNFETPRGRKRMEAARYMGAEWVYDTSTQDWKQNIKKDHPEGFDRVIITSPPGTIPDLLEMACFGGVAAFNGISYKQESITFNANYFHFNKLKLNASHAIPNWGFPRAFRLLKENILQHDVLVTHTFGFDQIQEAFEAAGSRDLEVIKVVVTF